MNFKRLNITGAFIAMIILIAGMTVSAHGTLAKSDSTKPQSNGSSDEHMERPKSREQMGSSSMMNNWKEQRRWMGQGNSMVRHMFLMQNGVPAPYQDKFNDLSATPETIRSGAILYRDNCASCHGSKGLGDGEDGQTLNPKPANLAHMIRMPMLNDPYLLWTVAEGGEPVGSDMPAFKDILSEEDTWQIVLAMRAGFPDPNSPNPINHNIQVDPASGLLSKSDVRVRVKEWANWYGNAEIKVGRITDKDPDTFIVEILAEDNSLLQRIEINRRTGWMQPAN